MGEIIEAQVRKRPTCSVLLTKFDEVEAGQRSLEAGQRSLERQK
jgi:hypothetical protein